MINIKRLLLNKLTPKDVILISLLLIIVATSLELGFNLVWLQVVTVCLVAVLADIGFNLIKKTKLFFPKSGLITGLIVSLVLPIGVNPLVAGFAAFSAIVSKKLLQLGGKHIFNPASFGLVLTAFLFDIHFGWWGDRLPLVVIVLGAITILRAKKDLQVITFLTSYIILEFIFLRLSITDNLEALKASLSATAWFFAFFMVSEPITSALPYRLTALFGFFVALTGIILSFIPFESVSNSSLLLGLLFSNLVAFVYLHRRRVKVKAV